MPSTASDGLKQAEHFLDVVGGDPGTLVLDFEPNPTEGGHVPGVRQSTRPAR